MSSLYGYEMEASSGSEMAGLQATIKDLAVKLEDANRIIAVLEADQDTLFEAWRNEITTKG